VFTAISTPECDALDEQGVVGAWPAGALQTALQAALKIFVPSFGTGVNEGCDQHTGLLVVGGM
jgi:hypothetical protein